MNRAELFDLLQGLVDDDLAWLELRTPTVYVRLGAVPDAPFEQNQGHLDAARNGGVVIAPMSDGPVPFRAPAPAGATNPTSRSAGIPVEHVVTAPFVGMFYRRPSPSEPPFVEVGTRVRTTDTVCLIEVMKVFNSLSAGVEGVVSAIEATDAELVEFGQVLMRITLIDNAE